MGDANSVRAALQAHTGEGQGCRGAGLDPTSLTQKVLTQALASQMVPEGRCLM